jgi:5-methylcytosine-specific restriction protein A
MDIIELNKRLKRIGKKCFVQYYDDFNAKVISRKDLAKRIHSQSGYTLKSCETRISNSIIIINDNMSARALKEIIQSNIPNVIKVEAQKLLQRLTFNLPKQTNDSILISDEFYAEGTINYELHKVSERSTEVVLIAKKNRLKKENKLECDICNFNFSDVYGELGEGFIEAHHTVPVSQMKEGHQTKPEDLALVCANCHRMLHRHSPLVDVKTFKSKYFK